MNTSSFSHRHYKFLHQINAKNIHHVYGSGIQTHNLQNQSLHSKPLEQDSFQTGMAFASF